MSRTLSSTALESAHAQQTDEIWLVLLTIDHDDLPAPLRLVNNNENVTSRGNVYQYFPFEIILPGEDPETPPRATLRVDNVAREVIAAIRSLNTTPTVVIEVILHSDPDDPEITLPAMVVEEVSYDSATIDITLGYRTIYLEPVTAEMTPNRFPGLF